MVVATSSEKPFINVLIDDCRLTKLYSGIFSFLLLSVTAASSPQYPPAKKKKIIKKG